MRLLVRKERPHPGAQLRFTDLDGLRLTCFATNTQGGQLADLELRHRRRAHRRAAGQAELPAWKEERNRSHKQVRARIEHTFARMKTWKILRDCRLKATVSTTPCSVSPA